MLEFATKRINMPVAESSPSHSETRSQLHQALQTAHDIEEERLKRHLAAQGRTSRYRIFPQKTELKGNERPPSKQRVLPLPNRQTIVDFRNTTQFPFRLISLNSVRPSGLEGGRGSGRAAAGRGSGASGIPLFSVRSGGFEGGRGSGRAAVGRGGGVSRK